MRTRFRHRFGTETVTGTALPRIARPALCQCENGALAMSRTVGSGSRKGGTETTPSTTRLPPSRPLR